MRHPSVPQPGPQGWGQPIGGLRTHHGWSQGGTAPGWDPTGTPWGHWLLLAVPARVPVPWESPSTATSSIALVHLSLNPNHFSLTFLTILQHLTQFSVSFLALS